MANAKIMTNNFLDSDIISNAYVSSENPSFPAENVYNTQRRSKVWRSYGYWNITASNNEIKFKESSGGSTLTATISAAEYSSDTLFFAAIKTALEDAGASTYTVSRETLTKKIKIASSGSYLSILWTLSSAADTIGYDSASDDTGALTYTADVIKICTEEWLKWDFGISTNPKSFIAIGLRNQAIKITPSATLVLQGNETDSWDSPSYSQTIAYDATILAIHSTTGLHTEALRYWRFKIVDVYNSLGYVELGSVYLGDVFEAERGSIQFPFSGRYIDRSPTVFSEGGQSFSDIYEQSESFSVDWFGLTLDDKEALDAHFENVGTHTPFFFAFDPNGAVSDTDDYYTRYVKFTDAPSYSLDSPGVFSMKMDLREEL
jgi:hypothetical protein